MARLVRAIGTLLVVAVLAVAVGASPATLRIGADRCSSPAETANGVVPELLRGAYAVTLEVQYGDRVLGGTAGLVVEADALAVTTAPC